MAGIIHRCCHNLWHCRLLWIIATLSLSTFVDSSLHQPATLVMSNTNGFDTDHPIWSSGNDGRRTRLVVHRERIQLVSLHSEKDADSALEQLPAENGSNKESSYLPNRGLRMEVSDEEIGTSQIGKTRRIVKQKKEKLDDNQQQKAIGEGQGFNERKYRDSGASLVGLSKKEKKENLNKLSGRIREKDNERIKRQKKDYISKKKTLTDGKDTKIGGDTMKFNKKVKKSMAKEEDRDGVKERQRPKEKTRDGHGQKEERQYEKRQKAMMKKRDKHTLKEEENNAEKMMGENHEKDEMKRKEEKRNKKKEQALNKQERPDQKKKKIKSGLESNATPKKGDSWHGHKAGGDSSGKNPRCVCVEEWGDDGWNNDDWSSHQDMDSNWKHRKGKSKASKKSKGSKKERSESRSRPWSRPPLTKCTKWECTTRSPVHSPSRSPTISPALFPTLTPSLAPTLTPTLFPTLSPTLMPTLFPTIFPTTTPTVSPTQSWSREELTYDGRSSNDRLPSDGWSKDGHVKPTKRPTNHPTWKPSWKPVKNPTLKPSKKPNNSHPTQKPSWKSRPTGSPTTSAPTTCEGRRWQYSSTINGCTNTNGGDADPFGHTMYDSARKCCLKEFGFLPCATFDLCAPTSSPSTDPTIGPTLFPTISPTTSPTLLPTQYPTLLPTQYPTLLPTQYPTLSPTHAPPTQDPSMAPSKFPSSNPSMAPSTFPSSTPTLSPTGIQCISNPQEGEYTYWPVCPGNDDQYYCDGDRDCGTAVCSCDAGVSFCQTGTNPCQAQCILDSSDNTYKPLCPGSDSFCNGARDCAAQKDRCSCIAGEQFCSTGVNTCSQPTQSPTPNPTISPTMRPPPPDSTPPPPSKSPTETPTASPTIVQCFHESQDGIGTYWPVCPGNDAKDYCNGEPPNCDSDRCTCEAGENFCKTKVNPCQTGCVLDTSDNIVKPICPGEDYYCDGDQDCNSGITNRCSCPTGELFCKGDNVCSQPSQSPTLSPTLSPTTSPTSLPTLDPSSPTTENPSADPTSAPTVAPTTDDPSISPTETPTLSPTLDPSTSPNTAPTTGSPSKNPTPAGIQCAYDENSDDNTYWPVCPGNDLNNFCTGDPKYCDTPLCDCEVGGDICRGKINPCKAGCKLDITDNVAKPFCPGEDYVCDGDRDCGSYFVDFCNCDTGKRFCDGDNVCPQPE